MAIPYGENQYIYGLHDAGGEHLLKDGDMAKGWVLVTEAIGSDPNDQSGKGDFYKRLADQGFGVIVRLNNAYGHSGTLPLDSKYPDFAQRAANFVRNSPGAHIWVIGNEMNFEREQPRLPGSSQAQPITPRRYTECYRLCRQAIKSLAGHQDDQVVVGPIGPWNGETPYEADPQGKYGANKIPGAPGDYPYHGFWGDYIVYMRDILATIGRENCDAIAIHAYSHGYDPPLVFSEEKMGPPFQNYYYHFRTYKDQMAILPEAFRDLPVYLTESNGDVDPNGVKWPDVNSGWVKNAYQEINDWNKNNQQIRCLVLYRWSRDDDWHIDGKGQVQQDLRDALTHNYQWDPDFGMTQPPTTEPIPEPEVPPYRTRYLDHNTPTTVTAAETLEVDLTIENVGSFTWLEGGSNPFRLGFQWYDTAGQFVQFPPELDFRAPLPNDVPPGGQVSLRAKLRTPDAAGTFQLRWDMVHELVTWFTGQGDAGLLVSPMTVESGVVVVPPSLVEIEDISQELAQHPTKRYATRTVDAIRRVIVHHTATPPTVSVQRIAEFQVNKRDLPGITYHFCTTDQGLAYLTQPLTVTAAHAGQNSRDSVGVCLIGNFMENPPPQPQLNAAASVLAQTLNSLSLTTNDVVGYMEIENTQSPGATWPAWKGPLLEMTNQLMATLPSKPEPPVAVKSIYHYMLFWYNEPGNWAEWDLLGAFAYIDRFHPALGFSVDEAKSAQFVTIVGGPGGVPESAEEALRAAGTQVERIAGPTEADTRRLLEEMAAENKRFLTLQA